ncbi:g_PROTEIN_RECEP_F1_2 domain-containing protein [Caerostris darwini]|uniref:G_PROTEIN_RECEP_F1_2 domain-containing protein n=1 Tax=Caerostris darwini TaxID=1538125 RepID=A0AAV4MER4_9ARAC|nr:g_PROTEIN_RECEP_F1_2 domain-containing protein [Caerostris darwini]
MGPDCLDTPSDERSGNESRCTLRLSTTRLVEKTMKRTLKMTCLIVASFFFCWTPYVVIHLWYLFDAKSAESLDTRQSFLFMFAVFNSCINPLVYGSYVVDFKGSLRKLLQWPINRFKAGNSSVSRRREKDSEGPRVVEDSSGFCAQPPMNPGEVYLELKQATPVRRLLNHGGSLEDVGNLNLKSPNGLKNIFYISSTDVSQNLSL